ncbi:hypothetical protein BGZ83_010617 [Gryganskiella cystojenkinii]|nr:hypothetical protein BGZ83_010617 [Gryganskiella cystojenkinii]
MDWLVLAGAAAEAVSQVLVVVGCGVILSRTGYLSQSAQKSISKVNLYFMTPCLLFTKIASTINWTQFKAFWPIPVFYVLFSTISWVVAKIGSRLLGFSKDEEKFVTASILFSNTNSLPMALLQSLAFSVAGDRLLRDANDTKEEVAARGISYILFYAIFGNLVRWSYGFTLLVPQDKEESAPVTPTEGLPSVLINVDEPPQSTSDLAGSTSSSRPFLLPTDNSRTPTAGGRKSPAVSIKSATESILMQRASTAYERIRQVLTPPLLTALMALVIGLVPQLHHLFMSPKSTVYRFLIRPIEGCGASAIPMILLCLGAQVVHFAQSASKKVETPPPSLPRRQPVLNHPAPVAPYQTGLGIYQDETSSDEDRGDGRINKNSNNTYGSGVGTLRSGASSSATLLQFHDQDSTHPKGRFSRNGSTSSTGTDVAEYNDYEEREDEGRPLLGDNNNGLVINPDAVSHYRIRWLKPIPFILFARMVLVPVISMPAIIFHPDSLSPILTMDPTFSLALVLISAAPTAINMIQICQIKGFFENEMAAVLFWSYCVFGIPCVLGWSLVGLWAAGRE